MRTRIGRLKFSKHLVCVAFLLGGDAGRGASPAIPFLSTPAFTAGRFSCTLHGESNATYIVLASTNLSDWTPVATNQAATTIRTLDFPLLNGRAFFKAQCAPMPALRFALAANGPIFFSGPTTIDSFNSEDPAASTDGLYDPAKAHDNGDVAAGDRVVDWVSEGDQVRIYGHVSTRWDGFLEFTSNTVAGSRAWIDSASSGIQPGWFFDEMNVFADVSVPFTGGYFTPASGAYLGTNYHYLLHTGRYQAQSIYMSSTMTMTVVGQAVLHVPGNFVMSGMSRLIIAPGASLKLYLGSTNNLFGGQGLFNQTGKATNLCIYGLPTCSRIRFYGWPDGSPEFVGVIYAPNAWLGLGGSVTEKLDFKGSVIAGSVSVDGTTEFHYDESLAGAALAPPPVWTRITVQPADQTVFTGSDVTFSVVATGTVPRSYLWHHGPMHLWNQTNSALTLTSVQPYNAGPYVVSVITEAEWVHSRTATLTVLGPPVITQQPESQDTLLEANVTFTVMALGTPPPNYQWRKDGVELTDQTNASLTLTNVQPADQGAYSVVVSNAYGSVTSAVAQLTVFCSLSIQVDGPGTISVDPDQAVFAPGSTVTLTANAGIDYEFSGWSGDAEGNQNPLTLTLDANKSVTAHFLPTSPLPVTTGAWGAGRSPR